MRGAATAPTGPGVTVGHRLVAPDPPEAASGPPLAPDGADLASGRSRPFERCACRPRSRLTAAVTAA